MSISLASLLDFFVQSNFTSDLVDSTVKSRDNNGNGGEPPMNDYVTHKELETSTEKILHQMDKHFADMQHQMEKRFNSIELQLNDTRHIAKSADWKANWILGILSASVVGIVVAAITTLFH